MYTKHLVTIGASAGGIETLRQLVKALPPDFAAAIAVVLHTSSESPAIVPEILSRSGPLPAVAPRDHERLLAGQIYVAPPDFHLLVEPGGLRLTKGPRENRFRPAIDPLFRSAAQVFGPAAIGVVLTGNLDDGAAGLWAIKQLGGVAIVQDPDDALFPDMPRNALRVVAPDYCLPVAAMADVLVRLTSDGSTRPASRPEAASIAVEVNITKQEEPMDAGVGQIGEPSISTCPECHGVLLALTEGQHVRFRCHTGHAFSPESLMAEINESIEVALWNAMRAMHEGQLLMEQMLAHAARVHPTADARPLAQRVDTVRRQVAILRAMIIGGPGETGPD